MNRHELPTAPPAAARHRLALLARQRWPAVTTALAVTLAGSAAQLAGPALIGRVIDAATNAHADARHEISRAVALYIACTITAAALSYLAANLAARVAEDALNELRREVFDHTTALPIDIVEHAGTGQLVSRVTGDVQTLTEFTRRALPRIVFAGSEAALTIAALVLIDPRLAAVAIAASVPLAAAASRWYFRHAPTRYRTERERTAMLTARLHETYAGARVLRLYRATDRARRRVLDAGRDVVDANMATTAARNRFRSTLQAAQSAALLAVLVAGTVWIGDDSITLGAVTASAIYLTRIIDPVTVVLEQVDLLQRATASLARIVGITTIPTNQAPRSSTPAATTRATAGRSATVPAVEIRGVTFGYQPDQPVLHDITLTIQPGEHLAIVGASGAGKTTLAKLLTRAHHPDDGHILINGLPLEQYPPEQLRATVALIVQEPHTFARSVADNIRLANPDLTEHDIETALAAVDAHEWARRLPAGLGTIVGPGHVPLTAPQQQQLALARLVAADPDIVILDEATADLDPIAASTTEQHLYSALEGRTIITIAHRLDTITTADRIAILDGGVLVGSGTHRALLAQSPAYRHLWHRPQ